MSDNPYQAPHLATANRSSERFGTRLQLTQLLLRLLGVFFVIEGLSGLVGHTLNLYLLQANDWGPETSGGMHEYAVAWIVGSLVSLGSGLYLVIGGQWVILNALTASSYQTSSVESADDQAY